MWKIAVGFAVFAGIALYMLSKGGDVDISGNEHVSTEAHAPAAAPASAPASK
ncbi:MAG: hypothetical protein ACOYNZ_12160 [Rhodoferax sp.]